MKLKLVPLRPFYCFAFIVLVVSPFVGIYSPSIMTERLTSSVMDSGFEPETGFFENIESTDDFHPVSGLSGCIEPYVSKHPSSGEVEDRCASTDTVVDLRENLAFWGDVLGETPYLNVDADAIVKIEKGDRIEYAVKASSSESVENIACLLSDYNIKIIQELSIINTLVVEVPLYLVSNPSSDFMKTITGMPAVDYFGPNTYGCIEYVPNDPSWITQWGPQLIGMPDAWDVQRGSHSVIVAIIDTGIDYTHPDISANYIPLGYDWTGLDDDPMDDYGHGTHCAGIAAATMDNSVGIAGVANVLLMAEKGIDKYGWGSDAGMAAAVEHAVSAGASVLSNSWGFKTYAPLVTEAIQNAIAAGVIVVASAGNSASDIIQWPACIPGVITVSATDCFDELASFSSYGKWVDVAAPGVSVFSTIPDNDYSHKSGTSMSAPHVAGLAALLWSEYPSYTAGQIEWLLRSTANDFGEPGWDPYFGWGRINASSAINGLPEHDLSVWLNAPVNISLGAGTTIEAHAVNQGRLPEVGVSFTMYINGSAVASTAIPDFEVGTTEGLSFYFQPEESREYNITIAIDSVPGETSVSDNIFEHWITVFLVRNFLMETPSYIWYDAVANGINLFMSGDDTYSILSLPFSFDFYGRSFTTVFVSSNGWLSFTNTAPYQYYNSPFPSDYYWLAYAVAPYWEDLRASDNIYAWFTEDFAVIQYNEYYSLSSTLVGTFQVVFFPDGSIRFNYQEILWVSSYPATVGLNFGDGFRSTSYSATYLEGVNDFSLEFSYADTQHELEVMLQTPDNEWPAQTEYDWVLTYTPSILSTTVVNLGSSDETGLDLQLYINETLVASEVIPQLKSTHIHSMKYTWEPDTPGFYNITAYVVPVLGEFSLLNNKASRWLYAVKVFDYTSSVVEGTWYDAAANGVNLNMEGYADVENISLPFNFPFYDRTFDTLYLNSHGWMNFIGPEPYGRIYYPRFPSTESESAYVIAPFWGYLEANNDVYLWSTPERVVIQFGGASPYEYSSGDPLGVFEVVLYESGLIEFNYQEMYYCVPAPIGLNYGNGIHHNSYPYNWLNHTSDVSLRFDYRRKHDLEVSLEAPSTMEMGRTATIQATASNVGQSEESAVELQLYIENTIVASTVIPLLSYTDEFTLEYLWTPENVGNYNMTAYVFPVTNETFYANNHLAIISRIQDTLPPEWVVLPTNQILGPGQLLSYQLEATDPSGIASWDISDRLHFTIDNNGFLISNAPLTPGIYVLVITLADPYQNIQATLITVTRVLSIPELFIVTVIGALVILSTCILVQKKRRITQPSQ